MQTRDRLEPFRPDPLVEPSRRGEVVARHRLARLEPQRSRSVLCPLAVLAFATKVEHDPRQVLEEPLVELGLGGEELVEEGLGLTALPSSKRALARKTSAVCSDCGSAISRASSSARWEYSFAPDTSPWAASAELDAIRTVATR